MWQWLLLKRPSSKIWQSRSVRGGHGGGVGAWVFSSNVLRVFSFLSYSALSLTHSFTTTYLSPSLNAGKRQLAEGMESLVSRKMYYPTYVPLVGEKV